MARATLLPSQSLPVAMSRERPKKEGEMLIDDLLAPRADALLRRRRRQDDRRQGYTSIIEFIANVDELLASSRNRPPIPKPTSSNGK